MATTGQLKAKTESREKDTYEAVRELIVRGHLAPGSRVIESDLVERLDADAKAVRASIERLEQEDLVTKLTGGRARWAVSPLTIEDARELHEITAELEGLAAARAARLEPEKRQGLLDELDSIDAKLQELADEDAALVSQRVAELETAFHCTIVDLAAGGRLRKICEGLKPQAARYVFTYAAFVLPGVQELVRVHRTIVDPITRGDAVAADRAIQAFYAGSAQTYARVMATVGERGTW